MAEVVVRLSDTEQEALRHELSEPYGHEIRIGIFEKLRAALAEDVREHREWEVRHDLQACEWRTDRWPEAQRWLADFRKRRFRNVRGLVRTVTTFQDGAQWIGPWVELEEERADG